MNKSEHALLVHRLNVISRAVKHFEFGRVYIVIGNGGVLTEIQIVKDGNVNYRFGSIDKIERFVDTWLVSNEKPCDEILRLRKVSLIAKSDNYHNLPSRMNNYEEKEMLQQRTDNGVELPCGAAQLRKSRQRDTAAGLRTGKPYGKNVGAKTIGSVVAAHGERHRATAIVSGHTSARGVARE